MNMFIIAFCTHCVFLGAGIARIVVGVQSAPADCFAEDPTGVDPRDWLKASGSSMVLMAVFVARTIADEEAVWLYAFIAALLYLFVLIWDFLGVVLLLRSRGDCLDVNGAVLFMAASILFDFVYYVVLVQVTVRQICLYLSTQRP